MNVFWAMLVAVVCSGIKIYFAYREYKNALRDQDIEWRRNNPMFHHVPTMEAKEHITEDAEYEIVKPKLITNG